MVGSAGLKGRLEAVNIATPTELSEEKEMRQIIDIGVNLVFCFQSIANFNKDAG